MDEPCASLDPIATIRIEELMRDLKKDFTIVIVTHNMQQAARVSDYAMMMITDKQEGKRTGTVIEYGSTRDYKAAGLPDRGLYRAVQDKSSPT